MWAVATTAEGEEGRKEGGRGRGVEGITDGKARASAECRVQSAGAVQVQVQNQNTKRYSELKACNVVSIVY